MHNLKLLLPFVLLASFFTACNKEGVFSSSPSVNAAFSGQIIDESGQPISGAQVRIEGEVAISDENGIFRLPTMRVPSDNAILMVTKIGYYQFSRAYYVEKNSEQALTIQLLHKEQMDAVNGAIGGTVQLPGGIRLIFPAGGFVDERGNAYNGTVRVFARSLDAGAADLALQMPGDLRGINQAGDAQWLGNHGMIGVELESQSGQKIRIRQGNEVEIHLPIARAQLSTAPTEISLWYFDLQQARWMEDGTAQRVGNEYVGRVKHFTFWSFSTAFNLVEFKGKVIYEPNQQPMSGVVVRLTMTSDSTKGFAVTNADGIFKGGVPMGETFTLDILNACGEVLFTQSVGPFTAATVNPDISVQSNGTHTVEITGRLLDCSGAPIKNGYAQVLLGNFKWIGFTGTDGSFTISKIRCDTSVGTGVIIGFDLQNQKQSPPDTISVPPNALAIGDLAVCDSLGEFIRFTLDYNDYIIAVPVGGIKDNAGMRTFLNGYSTAQQDVGISMEFNSDGQPGTFALSNLYVNTLTWNAGVSGINMEVIDPGIDIGDPMTGSFEGTFQDQLGVTHSLSGSYQVRRDY